MFVMSTRCLLVLRVVSSSHDFQDLTMLNSYTGKIMPFTGKALNTVTPRPWKRYILPCLLMMSLATYNVVLLSRGVFRGMVCMIDLMISTG